MVQKMIFFVGLERFIKSVTADGNSYKWADSSGSVSGRLALALALALHSTPLHSCAHSIVLLQIMVNEDKQDPQVHPQAQGEHSSVIISLHIKSLERTTHSVRLPRNSTVLQLKEHIQAVSQVDSQRQRLIFQGRVLKDEKNLQDYGNCFLSLI